MIKRCLVMLAMVIPLLACAVPADERQVFSLVPLQLGKQLIHVQLADTPQKRAQGLMFQQSADPGMFLLYSEPREISLWMLNTSMPLDVAYIDANWTIAELITLEPYDETSVPSKQPAIAALEMPRGWFAKYGVAVGQKVTLRPEQKP
ncbi:DUF192 domain-containing protein [Rheinheimera hassiensis]|uniref:DUF192 domain-containing protein n=1 Tax=Rheinheimera hassiensis TaxID=1193627 RepID=UPI001F05F629|nr:DUF192 domain-containing protein [Rheinheimera hassiensis]